MCAHGCLFLIWLSRFFLFVFQVLVATKFMSQESRKRKREDKMDLPPFQFSQQPFNSHLAMIPNLHMYLLLSTWSQSSSICKIWQKMSCFIGSIIPWVTLNFYYQGREVKWILGSFEQFLSHILFLDVTVKMLLFFSIFL